MSPDAQSREERPDFRALPSLFRICMAMGSTLELDKLLTLILQLTMKELRAQQGSILLLDAEHDQLKMLASRGMPREITRRGYIPRKGSIAEWVIENDKPLLLNDVQKDDKRFTSIVKGRPIYSSMCVPLRAKDTVIGTINITRTRRAQFGDVDLDALVVLATQAAVSIENARLFEENLQAERMATVGRTVAAISHCTKNMLTGLKGGAAVIEMGCKQEDWALVEQGWEMVKRNTDRVSLMVLDMLDYSKERVPTRVAVDLPRLIDEVFMTVTHAAQQAHVRLTSQVAPACRVVHADSNQVYRALLNLVTNAIDAIRETPVEEGQVEIKAERVRAKSAAGRRYLPQADGEIDLIHVRDTGIGIAEEHMPSLFQPFFSSKGSKGTGLGLAVTRKIAREHGGDVVVESQRGKGCVFTVVLPVADSSGNPPNRSDSATKT